MYEFNEGLAEMYGAMIGDGCLSLYYSNYSKRKIFCTLITGHLHDEPYYREILQPILFKEFRIKGCIRFRKDYNCTRFETTYKKVFEFFKNLGFPVGVKTKLSIPNMILANNNLAVSCLRGIFNTDGTLYSRYSKRYENHSNHYNYIVVQFKMDSQKIIEQIKLILERNSIKTTKIDKIRESYYVVRITEQQSVHKFMKLINSNHKYHTERYINRCNFSKSTGP